MPDAVVGSATCGIGRGPRRRGHRGPMGVAMRIITAEDKKGSVGALLRAPRDCYILLHRSHMRHVGPPAPPLKLVAAYKSDPLFTL